jgi:hypothetical protein
VKDLPALEEGPRYLPVAAVVVGGEDEEAFTRADEQGGH